MSTFYWILCAILLPGILYAISQFVSGYRAAKSENTPVNQCEKKLKYYDNLLNPSLKFNKFEMIHFLEDLIRVKECYEVNVKNVPNDRFDRISWSIFMRSTYKYSHVANVEYFKNDELIYKMEIKLANTVSEKWRTSKYNAATKTTKYTTWYPIFITIWDVKNGNSHFDYDAEKAVEYEIDSANHSTVLIALLSGFLNTAADIMWRAPLRGLKKENQYETSGPVTSDESGHNETDETANS